MKPVEYTWWPPKQFANATIGQFDIYPAALDPKKLTQLLQDPPQVQQNNGPQPIIDEIYQGIVLVRSFQTLHQQQVILHAVRDMCLNAPNKFKFHFITESDNLSNYDGVLSASE